jgi:copine 1/2/3
VVKDNLNPGWGAATVELSTLCEGDFEKPIRVVVYDYESSGKHVTMGRFETSVNGLINAATGGSEDMGKAFTLKHKGKETGKIIVLTAEVAGVEDVTQKMANSSIGGRVVPTPGAPAAPVAAAAAFVPSAGQPTFVDYVSGGCELQVCVAIDFTGSNGTSRSQIKMIEMCAIHQSSLTPLYNR